MRNELTFQCSHESLEDSLAGLPINISGADMTALRAIERRDTIKSIVHSSPFLSGAHQEHRNVPVQEILREFEGVALRFTQNSIWSAQTACSAGRLLGVIRKPFDDEKSLGKEFIAYACSRL